MINLIQFCSNLLALSSLYEVIYNLQSRFSIVVEEQIYLVFSHLLQSLSKQLKMKVLVGVKSHHELGKT